MLGFYTLHSVVEVCGQMPTESDKLITLVMCIANNMEYCVPIARHNPSLPNAASSSGGLSAQAMAEEAMNMPAFSFNGIWSGPQHEKVFADLSKALHGGKPFSLNGSFYGPAVLPINTNQASLLAGWLFRCVKQSGEAAPATAHTKEWVPQTADALIDDPELHQLAYTLASMKANWINHYRLCKPLAYQTFPCQTADELIQTDTLPMLQELATSVCLLHRCTVGLLGWPQAMWQVLLRWVAITTPILYGLGYHESVAHGAQVARWCVLSARLKAPTDVWLQLQAAIVGWFHDPKLHVRLSIDNVATHPLLASVMGRHILQQPWMHEAFYQAWRHHPPTGNANQQAAIKAPERLIQVYQGIEEALAINSDSRFVMDVFIVPAIRRHLTTPELHAELDKLLAYWHAGEGLLTHLPETSDAFKDVLCKTTLHSGLLAINDAAWRDAYQWWVGSNNISQPTSPEVFYQRILQGNAEASEAVQAFQQWMRQANLMDGTTFEQWEIPASLLLTHHRQVVNPMLAECLAAADPLMLSPHKILLARPVEEPLVKRVKSFLRSLHDNMADIHSDGRLPSKMVDGWHRQVLMLLARVAKRFNDDDTVDYQQDYSIEDWHDVLASPEQWGTVAWVDECSEKGACLIEHIAEALKNEFDEAEYHYLVASLQGA